MLFVLWLPAPQSGNYLWAESRALVRLTPFGFLLGQPVPWHSWKIFVPYFVLVNSWLWGGQEWNKLLIFFDCLVVMFSLLSGTTLYCYLHGSRGFFIPGCSSLSREPALSDLWVLTEWVSSAKERGPLQPGVCFPGPLRVSASWKYSSWIQGHELAVPRSSSPGSGEPQLPCVGP